MAAVPASTLIGPSLPAIRTSGGYFAPKDKYDTAWGDVILAIMCPIGGRWGNRRFGSSVPSLLFSPADAALAVMMNQYIKDTLSTWVPSVRYIGSDVNISGSTVSVNISFALASDPVQPVTKLFKVSRRAAVQFLASRVS